MKIYTLYNYDTRTKNAVGTPHFYLNTRAIARYLQFCREGEEFKGEAWNVDHELVPASELATKLDEQLYDGRSYGLILYRPSDAYDGSWDEWFNVEPSDAPRYIVFVNDITEKTPLED